MSRPYTTQSLTLSVSETRSHVSSNLQKEFVYFLVESSYFLIFFIAQLSSPLREVTLVPLSQQSSSSLFSLCFPFPFPLSLSLFGLCLCFLSPFGFLFALFSKDRTDAKTPLSTMSDDFEKAVLFAFDQSGNIPQELQSQAQMLLQNAAASPEAWQLCMSHMDSTTYAEVKFWCLQTLHAIILSPAFAAVPQGSRDDLKRALLLAGTSTSASNLPPFLRNKIAQVLVAIAVQEFPDTWPTFFRDVLLQQGREAVDLFCRVLTSIDEDIVSLEVPRSAEDAKRSMHFKDSMRDYALRDISEAWCNLVAAYKDSDPAITALILESIRPFVHWIDISLVANDVFVPLLFAILRECKEVEPRTAAAMVLTEIVSKRMDPSAKLDLLQRLGIVPICAQWATTGIPVSIDEPELAIAYSKLLASLATEVLESWKRVENSLLSMQAVGLEVGLDAGTEASSACSAASTMLDALFPAILAALRTGDDEIAAAVAPFLLSYVSRIRMLKKRNHMNLPADAETQLPAILEAVAECARFPEDSLAYEAVASTTAERVASEEEESSMAERRQELFALFKNAAKLAPHAAYAVVGKRLEMVLQQSSASARWQDVELPLSLLYVLGEGAPDEALKPGEGHLAVLAAAVVTTNVPSVNHRLVALALLETCARYTKVLQQQAELLPRMIGLFLGPIGLGHPSESVPPRAAYLFCRICKVLRQQMRPLTRDILQSLRPHLLSIASTPLDEKASANKAAGASGGIRNALGTGISAADDRLYAFEAAGLLIGSEEIPQDQQLPWLDELLGLLTSQIERSFEDPPLLQQALDALTRVSKGFVPRLCSDRRPLVGERLMAPLEHATTAMRRLPDCKPLRMKYLAYVHRLIESLGASFLPHISTVLWALQVSKLDAPDMSDIIVLLNQVIGKYPSEKDTVKLIKAVFADVVEHVHMILSDEWDWSGVLAMPAMASSPAARALNAPIGPAPAGSTEYLRERGELQRTYYAFLHAVTLSDALSEAMLAMNSEAISKCLNDLVQGAGSHVDSGVRKTCIQALGRLATCWLEEKHSDGGGDCGNGSQGSPSDALQRKGEASLSGAAASEVSSTSQMPDERARARNEKPDMPSMGYDQATSSTIQVGEMRRDLVPPLREFFMRQFGCKVLIEGLAGPDSKVDIRDAAAISLLTEIAIQLKSIYRLIGQEFLFELCRTTLPQMGWPAPAREQLASHITESDAKELKNYLKAAVQELRGNRYA